MKDCSFYKKIARDFSLAQKGDALAYQRALEKIGIVVMKWLRRWIHNQEMQDDVYQNILLNIHKARHTYDTKRSIKPWLYSITKNTSFDYLRKLKKQRHNETQLNENFLSSTPQHLIPQEKKIYETLKKLPSKYKEAFQMIQMDGYSHQEAAKKAKVSLAAIKVRAHRGYQMFKKFFFTE